MDADFLITGGGIAGLSAGAALARLGRDVVRDAEASPGDRSAGRSTALFQRACGLPPVGASNRASGPARARMGALSRRGVLPVGPEGQADALDADRPASEPDARAGALLPAGGLDRDQAAMPEPGRDDRLRATEQGGCGIRTTLAAAARLR